MRDMPTLEQLVCFAILMENNEGILGKSPDYLMEKYRACVGSREPEALLDACNRNKLAEYRRRWGVRENTRPERPGYVWPGDVVLMGYRPCGTGHAEGVRPPRGGSNVILPTRP